LQEFQEDIGALLPWHQLWAATLLGKITAGTLNDELNRTREASRKSASVYHRDDFHTSNEMALLWIDALYKLNATDESHLSVFQKWKDELKRPLFTPTLTALAQLLGQKEATKGLAVKLSLEAFNLIKDERSNAEGKSEGYINAARAI